MELNVTYPPELTPTARSFTIASSVSSVLSTVFSPLANMIASELVLTTAALELNPPPTGTVPSISRFMLHGLKSFPYFFLNKPNTPFRPLLK
jgi:hypothetical protein